jgi:phasin family protein
MLQRNNVAVHNREDTDMTSAKESFESFSEMSGKGYEAARQLGEINLRAVERLLGRQMDAVSLFMETGLRQTKLVSEAKGYSELVKGQIELAQDMGKRMLEEGRTNMQMASDTRDAYREWFEQGMETMRRETVKARQAA